MIKNRFKDFLIENECLEEYNDSLDNSRFLERCKEPWDFLDTAFIWDRTPSNHGFWSDLNDKWHDILDIYYHKNNCER